MTTEETHRGYEIRSRGDWYEAINARTGVRLTTGNRVEQVRRAVDAYLDRLYDWGEEATR